MRVFSRKTPTLRNKLSDGPVNSNRPNFETDFKVPEWDCRVALGVAPQGSHRSGRADFPHPARRVKGSLLDGTPSEPPAAAATENVATTD